METSIRKRNNLISSILRLEQFYDQVDHDNIDYDELEIRFEALEEAKKEFKAVHNSIISKSKPDELEGHDNEYASFEDRYIKLKSKFMKLKKSNLASSSPVLPESAAASQNTTTDIRLPRLDLPTYNGNIHEWLSFHDLFVTTIHNNVKLSGAQKLQYLKASLKGEASSLLNAFQVTDQNYLEAWNLLIQRYQNKKEIVQSHLKRLFNQATLQEESSSGLRKLVDTTTESLRSLKVLQQPIEYWDTIIVYLVTNKLDTETRKYWEFSQKSDELATWQNLMEFLDQRSRALAAINTNKPKPVQEFKQGYPKSTLACHGTTSYKCIVCCEAHVIFHCPQFLNMSIEDRKEVVKKNSLCFNCLHKGHSISDCKGGNCKHCNNKHNSLLHVNKPSESEDVGSHFSNDKNNTQVLLSTVNVLISDIFGKTHTFRALLDNGSQTSFITEKCVQQLQLKKRKTDINITGIGSISLGKANKTINCSLSSDKNDFSMEITACIVQQITGELPNHKVEYNNWTHLQGLTLADPQYYLPRHVDLLLGADVYADIILNGKASGNAGTPTAFNSVFGWTVFGKYTNLNKNIPTTNNFHVQCDVDTTIQKFCELEELPTKTLFTQNEKTCEDHFAKTHSHETEPAKDYRLLTATFGTSSAPDSYSAIKCVQQLAEDEKQEFPTASIILQEDLYVDDLLSGAESGKHALELQQQLSSVMERSKLKLQKLSSNNAAVIALPLDMRESKQPLNLDKDTAVKALGLFWNPYLDSFSFRIVLPPARKQDTKRSLLSDIGKHIHDLNIPRYIHAPNWKTVELHGFSDSSEMVYSAVYSRSISHEAWTASLSHRWNTFVPNIVTEIQEIIASSQYVHGPKFLQQKELVLSHSLEVPSSIPEERKTVVHFHNKKTADSNQRRLGSLSVSELDKALLHWIIVVQAIAFSEEIQSIKDKQNLFKTSKIVNRTPFFDNNRILRVGGSLKNNSCSSSQKNPILLPKRNNLTDLLLDYYHKTNLHCGLQLLLATLQRKYWILGAKDLINHFVRKCIICCRHCATPEHFLIGDSLTAVPEPSYTDLKQNHLSRSQYTQRLLQDFWNRWSAEFLSRLQQRTKWNSPKENLMENQLVLIKDERLPPLQWKLARVIDVHLGKDDLVRKPRIKFQHLIKSLFILVYFN